jgi:hypothetical protein
MLKQAGMNINIPDNVSANALEKRFPQLQHMATTKENIDARRDMMSERQKDRDALLGSKAQEKLSANDTKRLDTVNKLITPGLASSRSPLGKDVANLYAVQNAKALLDGENLDSIDTRQLQEVARVLDRVLSGGNPTISGTEHLTPDTAKMKIAKMMEYATSKRKGAGAGDFLKNNIKTFDREEALAKSRIKNTSQETLASYHDIAKRNPEAWDAQMAEHGLLDVMGSEALTQRKSGGPKNREETKPSFSEYPKTVTNAKTGHQATVKNEKEFKEAQQEGFQ